MSLTRLRTRHCRLLPLSLSMSEDVFLLMPDKAGGGRGLDMTIILSLFLFYNTSYRGGVFLNNNKLA